MSSRQHPAANPSPPPLSSSSSPPPPSSPSSSPSTSPRASTSLSSSSAYNDPAAERRFQLYKAKVLKRLEKQALLEGDGALVGQLLGAGALVSAHVQSDVAELSGVGGQVADGDGDARGRLERRRQQQQQQHSVLTAHLDVSHLYDAAREVSQKHDVLLPKHAVAETSTAYSNPNLLPKSQHSLVAVAKRATGRAATRLHSKMAKHASEAKKAVKFLPLRNGQPDGRIPTMDDLQERLRKEILEATGFVPEGEQPSMSSAPVLTTTGNNVALLSRARVRAFRAASVDKIEAPAPASAPPSKPRKAAATTKKPTNPTSFFRLVDDVDASTEDLWRQEEQERIELASSPAAAAASKLEYPFQRIREDVAHASEARNSFEHTRSFVLDVYRNNTAYLTLLQRKLVARMSRFAQSSFSVDRCSGQLARILSSVAGSLEWSENRLSVLGQPQEDSAYGADDGDVEEALRWWLPQRWVCRPFRRFFARLKWLPSAQAADVGRVRRLTLRAAAQQERTPYLIARTEAVLSGKAQGDQDPTASAPASPRSPLASPRSPLGSPRSPLASPRGDAAPSSSDSHLKPQSRPHSLLAESLSLRDGQPATIRALQAEAASNAMSLNKLELPTFVLNQIVLEALVEEYCVAFLQRDWLAPELGLDGSDAITRGLPPPVTHDVAGAALRSPETEVAPEAATFGELYSRLLRWFAQLFQHQTHQSLFVSPDSESDDQQKLPAASINSIRESENVESPDPRADPLAGVLDQLNDAAQEARRVRARELAEADRIAALEARHSFEFQPDPREPPKVQRLLRERTAPPVDLVEWHTGDGSDAKASSRRNKRGAGASSAASGTFSTTSISSNIPDVLQPRRTTDQMVFETRLAGVTAVHDDVTAVLDLVQMTDVQEMEAALQNLAVEHVERVDALHEPIKHHFPEAAAFIPTPGADSAGRLALSKQSAWLNPQHVHIMYALRVLRLRELRQSLLEHFNYFRSVWKLVQHTSPHDHHKHTTPFERDRWRIDDAHAQSVVVLNSRGRHIVYDAALADLDDLLLTVAKLASASMQAHKESAEKRRLGSSWISGRARRRSTVGGMMTMPSTGLGVPSTSGGAADTRAGKLPKSDEPDAWEVVREILEDELAFAVSKRHLLDRYVEALEHSLAPDEEVQLRQSVLDLIVLRPVLDGTPPVYAHGHYVVNTRQLEIKVELVTEVLRHARRAELSSPHHVGDWVALSSADAQPGTISSVSVSPNAPAHGVFQFFPTMGWALLNLDRHLDVAHSHWASVAMRKRRYMDLPANVLAEFYRVAGVQVPDPKAAASRKGSATQRPALLRAATYLSLLHVALQDWKAAAPLFDDDLPPSIHRELLDVFQACLDPSSLASNPERLVQRLEEDEVAVYKEVLGEMQGSAVRATVNADVVSELQLNFNLLEAIRIREELLDELYESAVLTRVYNEQSLRVGVPRSSVRSLLAHGTAITSLLSEQGVLAAIDTIPSSMLRALSNLDRLTLDIHNSLQSARLVLRAQVLHSRVLAVIVSFHQTLMSLPPRRNAPPRHGSVAGLPGARHKRSKGKKTRFFRQEVFEDEITETGCLGLDSFVIVSDLKEAILDSSGAEAGQTVFQVGRETGESAASLDPYKYYTTLLLDAIAPYAFFVDSLRLTDQFHDLAESCEHLVSASGFDSTSSLRFPFRLQRSSLERQKPAGARDTTVVKAKLDGSQAEAIVAKLPHFFYLLKPNAAVSLAAPDELIVALTERAAKAAKGYSGTSGVSGEQAARLYFESLRSLQFGKELPVAWDPNSLLSLFNLDPFESAGRLELPHLTLDASIARDAGDEVNSCRLIDTTIYDPDAMQVDWLARASLLDAFRTNASLLALESIDRFGSPSESAPPAGGTVLPMELSTDAWAELVLQTKQVLASLAKQERRPHEYRSRTVGDVEPWVADKLWPPLRRGESRLSVLQAVVAVRDSLYLRCDVRLQLRWETCITRGDHRGMAALQRILSFTDYDQEPGKVVSGVRVLMSPYGAVAGFRPTPVQPGVDMPLKQSILHQWNLLVRFALRNHSVLLRHYTALIAHEAVQLRLLWHEHRVRVLSEIMPQGGVATHSPAELLASSLPLSLDKFLHERALLLRSVSSHRLLVNFFAREQTPGEVDSAGLEGGMLPRSSDSETSAFWLPFPRSLERSPPTRAVYTRALSMLAEKLIPRANEVREERRRMLPLSQRSKRRPLLSLNSLVDFIKLKPRSARGAFAGAMRDSGSRSSESGSGPVSLVLFSLAVHEEDAAMLFELARNAEHLRLLLNARTRAKRGLELLRADAKWVQEMYHAEAKRRPASKKKKRKGDDLLQMPGSEQGTRKAAVDDGEVDSQHAVEQTYGKILASVREFSWEVSVCRQDLAMLQRRRDSARDRVYYVVPQHHMNNALSDLARDLRQWLQGTAGDEHSMQPLWELASHMSSLGTLQRLSAASKLAEIVERVGTAVLEKQSQDTHSLASALAALSVRTDTLEAGLHALPDTLERTLSLVRAQTRLLYDGTVHSLRQRVIATEAQLAQVRSEIYDRVSDQVFEARAAAVGALAESGHAPVGTKKLELKAVRAERRQRERESQVRAMATTLARMKALFRIREEEAKGRHKAALRAAELRLAVYQQLCERVDVSTAREADLRAELAQMQDLLVTTRERNERLESSIREAEERLARATATRDAKLKKALAGRGGAVARVKAKEAKKKARKAKKKVPAVSRRKRTESSRVRQLKAAIAREGKITDKIYARIDELSRQPVDEDVQHLEPSVRSEDARSAVAMRSRMRELYARLTTLEEEKLELSSALIGAMRS